MISFTVYDVSTGEIARTGSCQDSDLALQAGDGEAVIEGAYLDTEYYWDGSSMVAKPIQPSSDYFWDAASLSWVLDNDLIMDRFRSERNELLSSSDWTQMPDAPLDTSTKQSWAAYRQELRDLPGNTSDPENVVWPTMPEV